MMLDSFRTRQFKKDFKRILKQGYDIGRLDEALMLLTAQQPLPLKFKDHSLTGNWVGHRECHLAPDWLLIYRIEGEVLELVRTGSHSDLFAS